jgi:CYTH domain-containing protein
MGKEIERKFLVNTEEFVAPALGDNIKQGYLATSPNVRVRIINDSAFLTIKGSGTLVRSEFEYKIPQNDAIEILLMCHEIIIKTRYSIIFDGIKWEVDDFGSGNLLAEVELKSENQEINLPIWVGKEVTEDYRYQNSHIAKVGFPYVVLAKI